MTLFHVLSVLLQYPDERLLAGRDELRSAAVDERIASFVDALCSVDLCG